MSEPTPPSLSVEVWPKAAEIAKCSASATAYNSHKSVDTDDNEYYYFDYQLTASEAGGWRFDHFEWIQYSVVDGDPGSNNCSRDDNPTSSDPPVPHVGKYWYEFEYVGHIVEYSVGDLRAVFTNEEPEYTITTKAVKPNFGTTTGDGTYVDETTCTITATPATGFRFSHWKCFETGEVVNEASHTFTVNGDATWEAYFGTGRLIYLDGPPPPPTGPGDALVTFDFNPKTWICGFPYEHALSLAISYTVGSSTVSFTARGREVRTITQAQLAEVSYVRFNVTARTETCQEGYTPPQVQVVIVVQQQNTRTLSAQSMQTVVIGKYYRLDVSNGEVTALAEEG